MAGVRDKVRDSRPPCASLRQSSHSPSPRRVASRPPPWPHRSTSLSRFPTPERSRSASSGRGRTLMPRSSAKAAGCCACLSPAARRSGTEPLSWDVIREVREADVVHLYDLGSRSAQVGVLIAKALGKPVCATPGLAPCRRRREPRPDACRPDRRVLWRRCARAGAVGACRRPSRYRQRRSGHGRRPSDIGV